MHANGPEGRGRDADAAFTLIELLAGMVLIILLALILSQMLAYTSDIWRKGEASKERMQNERVICDFIATEVRAALLPVDRTNRASLQFVVNPAGVSDAFSNNDAIFWQAPLASDQALGDVAEIGYFVHWDTTTDATNPRAQLCRFFVNPGSGTTANDAFLIYSNPDEWISDEVIQTVAPTDKTSHYQGLFAENILGLWVRCLDTYGEPITQDYAGASLALANGKHTFDSRDGYTDSKGRKSASYPDAGGTRRPLCTLPPMVEISIVLLDTKSAARVGPQEHADAVALYVDSGVTDAASFIAAARESPSLAKISSGMRPYQMRINLQNAR